MAGIKKPKGEEFKKEDILQAVVIADSFDQKFIPVTNLKPRVRFSIMLYFISIQRTVPFYDAIFILLILCIYFQT